MEYRNPSWNATGGIDCEVLFQGEWLPATLRDDDPEIHGQAMFDLVSMEGNIAEYVPVIIQASEQGVRLECARRLMQTFGARDQGHLERLLNEATMDAVELMSIGAANWDKDQQTRAAQLNAGRALVKAHDAASKALRAMSPIPDDYVDDKYWP